MNTTREHIYIYIYMDFIVSKYRHLIHMSGEKFVNDLSLIQLKYSIKHGQGIKVKKSSKEYKKSFKELSFYKESTE